MKQFGDIHYGGQKMAWGKGVLADHIVFLSGVEGIDPSTGKCPPDVERQTKLALDKVKSRLQEAGTDIHHIAKIVTYIVGRENLEGYRATIASWRESNKLSSSAYASTLLLVTGLTRPEMLVEIDVTAVLPDQNKPDRKSVGSD